MANTALSEAIVKSQIVHGTLAPPMAQPCTRAMTGLGASRAAASTRRWSACARADAGAGRR